MTATVLRTAEDDDPGTASRAREVGLGVVFLGIGALIFALARAIELPNRPLSVSPRIWPEALGVGIMGLSVLQIVRSYVRPAKADEDLEPTTRIGRLRVVGFVLAIVAFGPLWYFVHFLISGSLLVAALTWISGGRGLKDLLLFPVAITAFLWVLFALLLKVPV